MGVDWEKVSYWDFTALALELPTMKNYSKKNFKSSLFSIVVDISPDSHNVASNVSSTVIVAFYRY